MSDRVARVERLDRSDLRPARRADSGRMRLDGVFTRAGIFEYMNADGSTRRELRPKSEVMHADSLASLELLPVVEEHPPGGRVGSATRAQGFTLEGVRADGDLVVGSLVATDAALIRSIENGKRALSVGYTLRYDKTPGIDPTYGRYDGVQRDIRGDHLAVVDIGRAGPTAQVRVDSADSSLYATRVPSHLTGALSPVIFTGGDTHNMTAEEIQKLQEALGVAALRADNAEKANVAEKARADAAEGRADSLAIENKTLRETRGDSKALDAERAVVAELTEKVKALTTRCDTAESAARFDAAVLKRVSLVSAAAEVLGPEFRADGKSDSEIRIAVLTRTQGKVDTSKGEAYLEARFDNAVEQHRAGAAALEQVSGVKSKKTSEARVDSRTSWEKMVDRNRGVTRPTENK